MTIAADMTVAIDGLQEFLAVLAADPSLSAATTRMGLIICALDDCKKRVEYIERGRVQRYPEVHEIEDGTVYMLDAWRNRLRAGEVRL